ncbi:MAG: hypothetical protein LBB72_07845 [Spirochaetaceae bacterium]|jgi:hypothetical protein|nr:hypothetical protein [Spirochaetaceae bacterium]
MQDILKSIPFDKPAGKTVHLDFSRMEVPYYVKNWFKVSIFYEDDTFPVDAVCSIFSPQDTVTIVIVIKRKFEDALNRWIKNNDASILDLCYRRRELYSHETSHLIAIIRSYPSNRSQKVRKDFEAKIRKKFYDSIGTDQSMMDSGFISQEKPNDSPSDFEKDHFCYENDNLNYFKLYAELMLPYNTLYDSLKKVCSTKKPGDFFSIGEILEGTLVEPSFFIKFPDKESEIRSILKEGFN